MAEIAVNLVIDNLVPLVKEELTLLKGVRTEANSLIDELKIIQPFLRDADDRADKGDLNDSVNAWVKQLRQISYQIEDVIDEYVLHLAQQRPALQPRHGFIVSLLHKVAVCLKKIKWRHEIASEIQNIKESLIKINERGKTYGLNIPNLIKWEGSSSNIKSGKSSSSSTWNDPRVASLFIGEAELVGIESPRNELISWLVEGSMKREVIVVVGMGGIGKTTLAKKVYDNNIVTRHFDCQAWIPVSQSYNGDEILKTMLQQFHIPSGLDNTTTTTTTTALIGKLRDYLNEKRYLVVFDDVWDPLFWDSIKYALPENENGNRLVITTRDHAVATSSRKDSRLHHIHKLQPLPEDKAWELFCKKAFQSDYGGICPQNLKEISKEILGRCQGLPLAIVIIGGILATKDKAAFKWQAFLNSLGSELASDNGLKGMGKVLSLSYIDLPHYLKPCYLYLGIFPEDYSINCSKLIRLWIAEGFVKEKTAGRTLEEVAEDYLAELIQRSLVQVSDADFLEKLKVVEFMI